MVMTTIGRDRIGIGLSKSCCLSRFCLRPLHPFPVEAFKSRTRQRTQRKLLVCFLQQGFAAHFRKRGLLRLSADLRAPSPPRSAPSSPSSPYSTRVAASAARSRSTRSRSGRPSGSRSWFPSWPSTSSLSWPGTTRRWRPSRRLRTGGASLGLCPLKSVSGLSGHCFTALDEVVGDEVVFG